MHWITWFAPFTLATVLAAQAAAPSAEIGANLRPAAGPVSMAAFGAKCDGVTDDTNAIQNALDSGRSMSIPPNSTCVVAGTLNVSPIQTKAPAYSRTVFQLNGSTLLFTGNGDGPCTKSQNGLLRVRRAFTITHGNLLAKNPEARCIINLSIDGVAPHGFATDFRADNIVFNANAAGSKVIGFYSAYSGLWSIDQSTFGAFLYQAINAGGANEGNSTDETDAVAITRNNFQRIGTPSIPLIYIYSPQAVTINTNQFEHGAGIQVRGNGFGESISIRDNWFGDSSPDYWIDVQHVAMASIQDNWIYSNAREKKGTGILLRTSQTCLVSGNYLYNQTVGIDMLCSQGSTIFSNNVQNADTAAKIAGQAANVMGNVFAVSAGGTSLSLETSDSMVGANTLWKGKVVCLPTAKRNTLSINPALVDPGCRQGMVLPGSNIR
jgi:parallel beta-helix repeat protein